MYVIKNVVQVLLLACLSGAAIAKLPALSDEAKAKAAEAAAKTAWAGKVNNFQLCKSQDQVAAAYFKSAAASGKPTKSATATEPCAEPGSFVYTAAPVEAKPIEAAGAHSPTATAASPPSGTKTDAVLNPAKPIEAAGAHSPAATAASPPSGTKTDAVLNPAKKP